MFGNATAKHRYFFWLDPLRFGSALGVAFFHHLFWSWTWQWVGPVRGFKHYVAAGVQFPSAARFTWFGWVGVEIFFVISGFVIANSASKSSPMEFLTSRALRLYPAVWVCSTATLVVLLVFAGGPSSEFILPYIKTMLLIPKGIPGPWVDGVYWTLAVEVVFYALVFCVLLTRKVTLLHLAWALTVYSGLYNAFAFLVVSAAIPSQELYILVLTLRLPWATSLLSHGCFFALGIWLFIAANRKLTPLERLAVTVAFLSGSAEIFCFSSFLLASIPAISGQSPLVPIVVWAISVFIIGVAATTSRLSDETASPAAARYLRTLGLITYPLYLTHNIVGSAIVRVLVHTGLNAALAVWTALGILVAVCWMLSARVEPAIRILLKRFFLYSGVLPGNEIGLGPAKFVPSIVTHTGERLHRDQHPG